MEGGSKEVCCGSWIRSLSFECSSNILGYQTTVCWIGIEHSLVQKKASYILGDASCPLVLFFKTLPLFHFQGQ